MKAFNGYDQAKEAARQTGSGAKLPPGAYKAKIIGVKYEAGKNGTSDRILIQFDITEGEFKDFFRTQYDENTSEDKKWKGKAAIYVPVDDGSERDNWTKRSFAKWTNALEDSNVGYTWDWDEKKWKNLAIGLMYAETWTGIDGKPIKYTEVRYPMAIGEVKPDVKIPDPKVKDSYKQAVNNSDNGTDDFVNVPEGSANEIPFD